MSGHPVIGGAEVDYDLGPSVDALVALMGILKAGGGYVPLDPSFPEHRLQLILEDAQASIVVTQAHLRHHLQRYRGQREVLSRRPPLDDARVRQWRDLDAARWSARPLDIDLALIEGETVDEPDLTVPHVLLPERSFVLVPLADVAGEVVHPLLAQPIAVLRDARPQAERDRKSTRLNSSHVALSRMPSSA